MICNEEGKLLDLPYNCMIAGEYFVGTILIAGEDGDEFDDVPCDPETFEEMVVSRD